MVMLIYRSHVVVVPSLCYILVVSLKPYTKSTINLFVKKTKLIETVVRRTTPTEKINTTRNGHFDQFSKDVNDLFRKLKQYF